MDKRSIPVLIILTILASGCVSDSADIQNQPSDQPTDNSQVSGQSGGEIVKQDEPQEGVVGFGCTGGRVMFDYPPVDLEKIGYIRPMGLVTGAHITPIDHQYYVAPDFSAPPGTGIEIDVYSPYDGTVTSMQHMNLIPAGDRMMAVDDYRLVIQHTCTISSIFIHIDNLNAKLLAVAPPAGEYASVDVKVNAGEVIGSYSGSVDYNVVDNDVVLTGYVIPESYKSEEWKIHTPDPFEYFNEPVLSKLIEKSIRTAEPVGGKIDYDVAGKLIGNWFVENTNKYGGVVRDTYYTTHLALLYDAIDPEHVIASFGDYDGNPGFFGIKGNSPDPKDVGVESGIVKYELVSFGHYDGEIEWDQGSLVKGLKAVNRDSDVRGVVLFQVLPNNKMKMEKFPGKMGEEVAGFSGNEIVYER